ncbi:DUF6183 family protein [Streptomyces sp. NPDC056683]|uniref:DUF6183 family protein n=1 Tax=Streptomyces sp. NPDC056683 TaxID=3345910 RepID=UPI0036CDBB95
MDDAARRGARPAGRPWRRGFVRTRPPARPVARFGAYGRLAAWRSLGGLVGAAPDAPIGHTARLVEQAHWFVADPSSDWFCLVAWDLAVAVLRAGGQEIAVLAATDTD